MNPEAYVTAVLALVDDVYKVEQAEKTIFGKRTEEGNDLEARQARQRMLYAKAERRGLFKALALFGGWDVDGVERGWKQSRGISK